ncbi:MAG: bifunctional riboflavin kinase/FAD synthetase [Candidatus Nanopelagicales bacterium]|nr:bifunctional riboflavin kinase/FAD synthetase [Candidatus Nanopelagicales bacterium]
MHLWRGVDEVPPELPPTSVTIGTFDGVHRGHRILLDRVVADAAGGSMPVAITFDPHPLSVIRPDVAPLLLTGLPHRLELLAAAGIQGVLALRFTPEVAAESAEHFATRVLAQALNARHVVVGSNFRFGHRAAGDVVTLTELGRELGFDVTVVALAPMAGEQPVSSTAIRAMVAAGDVAGAAEALGRPHRVSATVVRGDQRGRDLGYPTANLDVPEGIAIPADGVYAAWFRAAGEPETWRAAAVSVGTNPTFDGEHRRVEAHVIDAPEPYDVYDHWCDVAFVARLRGMQRFDSVDELVGQMAQDVERARACLASKEVRA